MFENVFHWRKEGWVHLSAAKSPGRAATTLRKGAIIATMRTRTEEQSKPPHQLEMRGSINCLIFPNCIRNTTGFTWALGMLRENNTDFSLLEHDKINLNYSSNNSCMIHVFVLTFQRLRKRTELRTETEACVFVLLHTCHFRPVSDLTSLSRWFPTYARLFSKCV